MRLFTKNITANVTLHSETLEASFLKSGKRQKCLLLSIPFYTVLEGLVSIVRQEKEIKVTKIGIEATKLSLFAHYNLLTL